ncbi:Cas10/Cmr2 second palm domain-containing protein [Clostridium sp. Marseille-P2415]|uniref:Cas10/Cmr2 second palm domain-containing protein n=1 Tax=Clostridium sp. Marseille-P2415 TaxID=1805471 RepID=UPI00098867B7|nr:hypothetical protein [Clostridium sp. Marseille-P2415]
MTKQICPHIFLAVFDVSGIQDYIFATNRLQENTGASIIVTGILKESLPQALKNVEKSHPERKAITDWMNSKDPLFWVDGGEIFAEIIYIGGGNAMVAFQDKETYQFTREELAKEIISRSTSLTVASCICNVNDTFPEERKKLLASLEEVKRGLIRQSGLSLFPIVEQDTAFGLPITGTVEKTGEKVTSVQMEKRTAFQDECKKEDSIFITAPNNKYRYAVEMKDLVLKEEEGSYVAVVHIDGNGMGDMIHSRIQNMESDFKRALTDMKELSKEISRTYQNVFNHIVEKFCQTNAYLNAGKTILPLRPVVLDGDDVTFICKGSLGIPLAAAFLRLLMKETKGELTACAGIALVHNHFPFRIAYETAEACCANAKKSWYGRKDRQIAGYLDFQLMRGASQKELKQLRSERFPLGVNPDKVMLRPYCVSLECDMEDDKSFDFFHELIKKLPAKTQDNRRGKWPRSRLKRLYETYLMGTEELEALKQEYASRGYDIRELMGRDHVSMFDALEVMDLYDRNLFDALQVPEERKSAENAQGSR